MENEKKKKVNVPSKTEKQVMKEFSNLCAICGETKPQLHHIDEDRSNNDSRNLIPLCPNCHLNKVHAQKIITSGLLKLLREYKIKSILSDKFTPFYKKMRFLSMDDIENYDSKLLREEYNELISFISNLKMGSEYSKRIKELLYYPKEICVSSVKHLPDSEFDDFVGIKSNIVSQKPKIIGDSEKEFKKMCMERKGKIKGIIIEQLVYQDWV